MSCKVFIQHLQDFGFTNDCPTHISLILHISTKDIVCGSTVIYSTYRFPNYISLILHKFTKDLVLGLTVIYITYKFQTKHVKT